MSDDEYQYVQVRFDNGTRDTYTFKWPGWGTPLNIGDRVTLPPNRNSSSRSSGTVTGFGKNGWTGGVQEIIRVRAKVLRTDPA